MLRLLFGSPRRAGFSLVGLLLGGAATVFWWADATGRLYGWLPMLAPLPITEDGSGQLIRVVDGDTVVVRYHDLPLQIRIRNIDTAESVHPDPERNTRLGRETSAWAKDHLDGARVRLEFHRAKWGIATDQHGRALAEVWIDRGPPGPDDQDELYAETVIAAGLSRYVTAFGPSIRNHARLQAAENQARRQGLGLWRDGR
jgi:micrococcal nuclease